MADPIIQQNLVPNEPDLKDLMALQRKDIFLNLNCQHIVKIQTFNPALQTATATVNYKKTVFEPNPITKVYQAKLISYPVLVDCPVVFLGGGVSNLTFPVKPGDDGIALFNDRSIDNWFQGSSTSGVAQTRLHSFSDGIILVGVRAAQDAITDFDNSRPVLKNGLLSRVGVDADGPSMEFDTSGSVIKAGVLIDIENTASGTLGTLLQQLLSQLTTLTTQLAALTVTGVTSGPGTSGPPANAAAFVVIQTQLTTIATKIAGLLS